MDDIKVGEYIRCGSIGIKRVKEVIKDLKTLMPAKVKSEDDLLIDLKYIRKHDKHLLNLIEVGDIVNDRLLTSEDVFDGKVLRPRGGKAHNDKFVPLKENEIESIVTHEQIERDTYYVRK